MPRNKRVLWSTTAATAALFATALIPGPTATAVPAPPGISHPDRPSGGTADLRHTGPDYQQGKSLKLNTAGARARARSSAAAAGPAQVGDTKTWLALDDANGSIYLKSFQLRGLGDHIQLWVAQDTAFPEGDCRTDLGLTDVTDAQVAGFVEEFDTNIYPIESAAFSTPPDRDGTGGADLAGAIGEPADYWQVEADQADDIVVLVDNVRDANYYEPASPDGQTYIAGFFYSIFNEYVDRNVMTIDAFDWLHRTGADPVDHSTDPAYIACAAELGSSRPYGTARPRLYEGTFAHEYQHLLEYYADPDEESWVNEGLSDWAQTLVGYVDPSIAPDQPGADGHLACFQGFSDPAFGGPENSLTEWGDQGGPEILCDYGAAYSVMEYLASHYGPDFMSRLHNEDGNGLAGLDAVLNSTTGNAKPGKPGKQSNPTAIQTLHNWSAAMALDSQIKRGTVHGGDTQALSISSMNAKINWENPQAYEAPGAPANGSDYVRLRSAAGGYLEADQLRSLSFEGAATLEPVAVEWTEDATPPETTAGSTCGSTGAGSGPAALYSGCGENFDRSIVREVTVPAGGAALTFDALWHAEDLWDYGFVQVSDDGGATWTSLETADTTAEHDPGAVAAVVDQLPGFTGDSGTWRSQSADLSAYAGQEVLVGFRYITDPGVNEAGFWVRNIAVGETALPSTLDGWQTISQVNPTKVPGFTVQLVGYDADGRTWYHRVDLDEDFTASLSAHDLRKALGKRATTVAAIVTFDDPSESITQQAGYALRVNGVLQPGG